MFRNRPYISHRAFVDAQRNGVTASDSPCFHRVLHHHRERWGDELAWGVRLVETEAALGGGGGWNLTHVQALRVAALRSRGGGCETGGRNSRIRVVASLGKIRVTAVVDAFDEFATRKWIKALKKRDQTCHESNFFLTFTSLPDFLSQEIHVRVIRAKSEESAGFVPGATTPNRCDIVTDIPFSLRKTGSNLEILWTEFQFRRAIQNRKNNSSI